MIFEQIKTAIEIAETIEKFVEGEMAAIVSAIAENEFQTAARALEDLPEARDGTIPVRLALGHLQSAHTAYASRYAESGESKDAFRMGTRMTALQKDVFTLCLIAICYKYLGEPKLMEKSLKEALEAIKPWTRVNQSYTLGELADPRKLKEYFGDAVSAVASWTSKGNWTVMGQAGRGEFPQISEQELVQFCTALRSSSPPGSSAPAKKKKGRAAAGKPRSDT